MDDVTRLTELLDQSPGMGGSAGMAVRLLDAGFRFTDRETCPHVVRSDEGTAYCGLGAEYTQRLTDQLRETRRQLEEMGRAMPWPLLLPLYFGNTGSFRSELDAIRDRQRAGESAVSVADDYVRPVWLVERVRDEWTGTWP
jgi:hypothetical protein